MDEHQQEKTEKMIFFSEWMKSSADLWASMMKMTPAATGASADLSARKPAKSRSLESLESALKMWQSLSSAMSEPSMADAAVKGINALPDVFLKIAQASWDVCFQIQKSHIEKAGKISQQVEAYQFENMDQELFKALKEIYEKEIKQFFHIPQLGLTRFYQERISLFMDRFNLLEATTGEFMSMLNLPFEQTFKVMQQELEKLAEQGKVPKETKEYYNLWVKILEGHFMTLFKSPEYNQTLSDLFNTLSEFIIAKNEVFQDILQILPVPTHKEMDELYRDLHILKKKVRELERQLNPA
jgi:polyhydroxyalkanoate synthase subunit PhaE